MYTLQYSHSYTVHMQLRAGWQLCPSHHYPAYCGRLFLLKRNHGDCLKHQLPYSSIGQNPKFEISQFFEQLCSPSLWEYVWIFRNESVVYFERRCLNFSPIWSHVKEPQNILKILKFKFWKAKQNKTRGQWALSLCLWHRPSLDWHYLGMKPEVGHTFSVYKLELISVYGQPFPIYF